MKKFIFIFICLFILFSCFSKKTVNVDNIEPEVDSYWIEDSIENYYIDDQNIEILEDQFSLMFSTSDGLMAEENNFFEQDRQITQINSPTVFSSRAPSSIINIENNDDISNGRVLYQIPNKMKVGETKTVFLRLSRSNTNVEIYENLDSNFLESNIRTSSAMSVELIDPSPDDKKMFYISKTNSQIQLVDSSYTEWIWSVKAIRSGDAKLKIVVKIASDNIVKETVYQSDVKIKINPRYQILSFIEKWWMWLITTIIIPIVTWYFKNRGKN